VDLYIFSSSISKMSSTERIRIRVRFRTFIV